MIRLPWLTSDSGFPPVETALDDPPGLLAAGGDLSPERLLQAYALGIFPWYGPQEPPMWWSPDPRLILRPEQVRVRTSLAKTLRNRRYEVRCDSAFAQVMRACAEPRRDGAGTWIGADIIDAYCELHRLGYAHSVETWIDGELAGGFYGVCIGRMFFGESMFSRSSDASKIALVHACRQLQAHGFPLIDCQMQTAHLQSMGAQTLDRSLFCREVAELVRAPSIIKTWDFHIVSPAGA